VAAHDRFRGAGDGGSHGTDELVRVNSGRVIR
jgi:hypothetical protein